ncbi:MAG: VOC family protein [Nakamurella sp.]
MSTVDSTASDSAAPDSVLASDGAHAPTPHAVSHVSVTVTDLEKSAEWYARALGMKRVRDMQGDTWRRVLMLGSGVMIGLQTHNATKPGDQFDETRVGLDHLSLACADRSEVEAWLAHLDSEGIAHSEISSGPAAVATVKDPDGIALEFFAPPAAS